MHYARHGIYFIILLLGMFISGSVAIVSDQKAVLVDGWKKGNCVSRFTVPAFSEGREEFVIVWILEVKGWVGLGFFTQPLVFFEADECLVAEWNYSLTELEILPQKTKQSQRLYDLVN